MRISPPENEDELLRRARALCGMTLTELGTRLQYLPEGDPVRSKGRSGMLLEVALGTSAGGLSAPDFLELGIELKTIPTSAEGRPRESTFVCHIDLKTADRAEWETSPARKKLQRVLFVPIVHRDGERHIGSPMLWSPTDAQESILRDDFESLMGEIGAFGIEGITAHMGRWLQIRPKARDGSVRTLAYGDEGVPLATVPRGFYLRTLFTGAILHDREATP